MPAPASDLKRRALAVALMVAAAGTGAASMLLTPHASSDEAVALPVAPADGRGAVRVMATAYEPPAEPAVRAAPTAETAGPLPGPSHLEPVPPLPVAHALVHEVAAAPKAVAESIPEPKPPAPIAKVPAPQAVPPALPKTEPKPADRQKEQQPGSAVVLDEVVSRSTPAQPAPPAGAAAAAPLRPAAATPVEPQAAPQPPVASVSPVATVAAAPAPAAAPVQAPVKRGAGLIAITPDSKLAVFTNPQTRLPQQFRVGDQLPGGDTLRSIDAKDGRVVSSSKEYTLD